MPNGLLFRLGERNKNLSGHYGAKKMSQSESNDPTTKPNNTGSKEIL
jgi:hypothetical protein